MDEFIAIVRARQFVRKVRPDAVPVSVERYAAEIGVGIKYDHDLGPDEAGGSFEAKGKRCIYVNAHDGSARQRFTVCHEIAHFVLGLPSDHQGSPSWSYAKRPPNEIWCDVFAAELLLPIVLFKQRVAGAEVSLAWVETLAEEFEASFSATGSRFAAVAEAPCAFVLAEQGTVRYASRSKALRDAFAMILPGTKLPRGSLSERLREGRAPDGPEQCEADRWFAQWERGGVLLEEARHLEAWDQTLTLLWFEDEEVP